MRDDAHLRIHERRLQAADLRERMASLYEDDGQTIVASIRAAACPHEVPPGSRLVACVCGHLTPP